MSIFLQNTKENNMKKIKNSRLNIAISEDLQSEMAEIRDKYDINWSEKVRNFIQHEIRLMNQENQVEFTRLMSERFSR